KIARITMARIAAADRIAARSRRSRSKASSHGPRLRMYLEVIATFLHRQEGNDKPSGGRANRRIVERAPAIHWRTVRWRADTVEKRGIHQADPREKGDRKTGQCDRAPHGYWGTVEERPKGALAYTGDVDDCTDLPPSRSRRPCRGT